MLAEADVRSATVTLPEGVQLNPSAANGLQACSETQIGYQGPGGEDPLAPGAEEPLHFSNQPAACPQASKLGVVRLRTPLLGEELHGAVYLAEPAPQGEAGKNPFDSLLALYIVAENPALGIRAKLAGEAKPQPATGQITSTFADTPQVPFEELDLQLFGGPAGSLTTPSACGSYTRERVVHTMVGHPVGERRLRTRVPDHQRARRRVVLEPAAVQPVAASRVRPACRPAATPASTCTSPVPTATKH